MLGGDLPVPRRSPPGGDAFVRKVAAGLNEPSPDGDWSWAPQVLPLQTDAVLVSFPCTLSPYLIPVTRDRQFAAVCSFLAVHGPKRYTGFLSGQIVLNHALALDSAWTYPEESRLLPGPGKPHFVANHVAVSRLVPTVLLAPQRGPGWCQRADRALCPPAFATRSLILGRKTLFVVSGQQEMMISRQAWLLFIRKLSWDGSFGVWGVGPALR